MFLLDTFISPCNKMLSRLKFLVSFNHDFNNFIYMLNDGSFVGLNDRKSMSFIYHLDIF